MADSERSGVDTLIEKVKEAVDSLAEAFDHLVNGARPVPALIPIRQPTAEDIRRARQRQRGSY